MEIAIPSVGGKQAMTCLALRKLNGWLQTISATGGRNFAFADFIDKNELAKVEIGHVRRSVHRARHTAQICELRTAKNGTARSAQITA